MRSLQSHTKVVDFPSCGPVKTLYNQGPVGFHIPLSVLGNPWIT